MQTVESYKIYTTKPDCPFCIKAKQLLDIKGLEYEYIVLPSKEKLLYFFPEAETVPQITHGVVNVGGFDDLVKYLPTTFKKKRTMFNTENAGHLTGEYPLFFGDDLGFVDTINTNHPKLDEFYQEQLANIWNEFEVDLTQDRQDMINAPKSVVDLMTLNLNWQTLVDSMANRSVTSLLAEFISNPDLEAWYNIATFFETIHARTYLHIIKQTYINPNHGLTDAYANKNVLKRAQAILEAFDALANTHYDETLEVKKERMYLAVVALYLLESVNFMSSFSVTFGIAETGIFQGISQDVGLIMRDEILHAKAGKYILQSSKEELAKIMPQVQALFNRVVMEEQEWNEYLYSEGRQCTGINRNLSNEYVYYLAKPVAESIGVEYTFPVVEENPLPYMDIYMDSSKIQVAAQELQLTNYLVNAVLAATPDGKASLLKELQDEYYN